MEAGVIMEPELPSEIVSEEPPNPPQPSPHLRTGPLQEDWKESEWFNEWINLARKSNV